MTLDPKTEEAIREKIEEKFKLRNAIQIFGGIYVLVTIIVWAIWFLTGGDYHPWPIYPTLGMSIPLFIMLLVYYSQYGGGAERRERMIEEEIARERQRLGLTNKLKNDDLFYDKHEDAYEDSYNESLNNQR